MRLRALAVTGLSALLIACGGGDSASEATSAPASQTAGASETVPASSATASSPAGDIASATSGDVTLAIDVPDGALPAGVSADDIAITAADPAAGPGGTAIAAFELSPDGLRFDRPIDVVVTLPEVGEGAAIGALLVSSDGSTEGLELSTVPLEREDDPLAVRFQIEHFSLILITAETPRGHRLSLADPIDEDEYTIGESFSVRMRIDRASWESDEAGARTIPTPGVAWEVSDRWFVAFEGALEPGDADSASNVSFRQDLGSYSTYISPPGRGGTQDDRVDVDTGTSAWIKTQTFVCVRPGPFAARLDASVQEQVLVTETSFGVTNRTRTYEQGRLKATLTGECKLPPIVAVATPPTTTYTIDLPADGGFSFGWSGADCGGASGTETNTFVWTHGGDDYEDCDHTEEAHPGTVISVLISSDKFEARCTFPGAASGREESCERTQ